jgi:hypothetical protein
LFLIGQFLKIFSSVTAWPNEMKHGNQVLVHLAKRFQRRFFLNQKQELPVVLVTMFINRSGRNVQSL